MPPNDQLSKVTSSKGLNDGAAEGCIQSTSGLSLTGSTQTPAPSVLQYPDIPQYIPPGYAGGPWMPSRDPEDPASPPSQVRSVPLSQFGTVLQRAKSDRSPPPSLWEQLSKVPITDQDTSSAVPDDHPMDDAATVSHQALTQLPISRKHQTSSVSGKGSRPKRRGPKPAIFSGYKPPTSTKRSADRGRGVDNPRNSSRVPRSTNSGTQSADKVPISYADGESTPPADESDAQ